MLLQHKGPWNKIKMWLLVAIQSTHMERRERMKQSSSQTRNCVPWRAFELS